MKVLVGAEQISGWKAWLLRCIGTFWNLEQTALMRLRIIDSLEGRISSVTGSNRKITDTLMEIQGICDTLKAQLAELETALREEIREHEATKQSLHERIISLESERVRRIAAETVASERREEIERLMTQNRELREDLRSVNSERLRSVDAINLKLMRDNTPEPAPNMEQFKRTAEQKQMQNAMLQSRRNSRLMDIELLNKFRPGWRHDGIPMNESIAQDEPAEVTA